MAQNTIKSRMSQKHDIEENWLKAINFIPMAGEIIVYDKESDDGTNLLPGVTLEGTGRTKPINHIRFKIGDGTTNVNELPFDLAAKTKAGYGIEYRTDNYLGIACATTPEILARANKYKPITPAYLETAVTSVGDEHYADKVTTETALEKLQPVTYTNRYNDFLITPKNSEHLDVATKPAIGSGSGWHRIHIGQRRAPGTLDISLMHRYWGPATQNLSLKFSGFVDWPENNNTGKIKPTLYQFYNCYYGPEEYDVNDIHARITKARIGWGDPTAPDAITNPMLCYIDVYVELDDEKYKTKFDSIKNTSPTAQCEIGLTALFYGDANKNGTYPILTEKESVYHTFGDIDYDINEYGALGEKLVFHEFEIDFTKDIKLEGLGADTVSAKEFNVVSKESVGLNSMGNLENVAKRGSFEVLTLPEGAISELGAFYHKYNMLPFPSYVDQRQGLNGMYVDIDSSGALIFNGTATANTFKPLYAWANANDIDGRSNKSFFLPQGTYKISSYLEIQLVYEDDLATKINNPHISGNGNAWMAYPNTDNTAVSTFTVDAPGAWVVRVGMRFRANQTYSEEYYVPFLYKDEGINYSFVGDNGFITMQNRTTGEFTNIENYNDFYGDVFYAQDSMRMNEIFNQSNYSTLMIRALEQNDIVLNGETPLGSEDNTVDMSEYAKKSEVSNAFVKKIKGQNIIIDDISILDKDIEIEVSSCYNVVGDYILNYWSEAYNGENASGYKTFIYISQLPKSMDGKFNVITNIITENPIDDAEIHKTIITNNGEWYYTYSDMAENPLDLSIGEIIYCVSGIDGIDGFYIQMKKAVYDDNHVIKKFLTLPATIYKTGKNLISGGDEQGKFELNRNNTGGVSTVFPPQHFSEGTTLTFTPNNETPEVCYFEIYIDYDNGDIGQTMYSVTNNPKTFTVSLDGTVNIEAYYSDNAIFQPQLEYGPYSTEFEVYQAPATHTTDLEGKLIIPIDRRFINLYSSDPAVCLHAIYNRDINDAYEEHTNRINDIDNVLRDILLAIREGGTTADTIDAIENLLVSYLEDKTVEEVEG